MSQVIDPLPCTQEPAPNRIRWTRAQSNAIYEAGILNDRYELIDGEIISKMGQNPPHRLAVVLLHAWLAGIFGILCAQCQMPIDVGDADPDHNEPQPDVAVTVAPNTAYDDRHPGPADLVLVAEVSDTTLRFDRTTKAALYSRAGIREYWIIDLTGRQIFVHRAPAVRSYAEIAVYGAEEMIAPLARPDMAVRVADLLPPLA